MDRGKPRLRPAHPRVLRRKRSKLGMGSRVVQQGKQEASFKGNQGEKQKKEGEKSEMENQISPWTNGNRWLKMIDSIWLTLFWSAIIILAEILKWKASFHLLDIFKGFKGG